MLGPALIAAVAASGDATPLMSLPLEEIFCFEREAPPPPLLPVKGRVCVEIDGIPGAECWPDPPLTPGSLPMLVTIVDGKVKRIERISE